MTNTYPRVLEWLEQTYAQRSDERQKSMGLAYMEAETHDLAREISRLLLRETIVPGVWHCRTCGLVQYRSVLNPETGACGANRETLQEPCPNDGDVMFPMTWREELERTERLLTRVMPVLPVLRAARDYLENVTHHEFKTRHGFEWGEVLPRINRVLQGVESPAEHPIDRAIRHEGAEEWRPEPGLARVVCAAMRFRETGRIICGARHWDPIMRQQKREDEPWDGWEDGFIDQFNQFLTRAEAWDIAVRQGQIHRKLDTPEGTLYSEHLY